MSLFAWLVIKSSPAPTSDPECTCLYEEDQSKFTSRIYPDKGKWNLMLLLNMLVLLLPHVSVPIVSPRFILIHSFNILGSVPLK